MKRGLIKAATQMLDFACVYAGEGRPDARDEQLPIFEAVKKATLEALAEHNQLTAIAKAAREMLAKCPADSDATQSYATATAHFEELVAKYNAKRPGAI
jgi:hypothetical protein